MSHAVHTLQGLLAQQQLQKPHASGRVVDANTAAGLQAAAAAVAGQLKLLGAQQGEAWLLALFTNSELSCQRLMQLLSAFPNHKHFKVLLS